MGDSFADRGGASGGENRAFASYGGRLRDERIWREALPGQVFDDLVEWADSRHCDIGHSRWITEGSASGARIAKVIVSPRNRPMWGGVLKLVPQPRVAEETRNIAAAMASPAAFVNDHLVPMEATDLLPGSRWGLHLQRFVEPMVPLSHFASTPDFGIRCAAILASVLVDWNKHDRDPWSEPRPPAAFLNDFVCAYEPLVDGLRQYAAAEGFSYENPHPEWRSARMQVSLPNPFALLRGTITAAPTLILHGNGHGDLHADNILVAPDSAAGSTAYRLIDLGRFSDEAAISRDPVKLVLSAVERFISFNPWALGDAALAAALAEIAATGGRTPEPVPDAFRTVADTVRAIDTAAASWAVARDTVAEWRRQHHLTFVGAALRKVGATGSPIETRRWYFYAASLAAREFLRTEPPPEAALPGFTPTGPVPSTSEHWLDMATRATRDEANTVAESRNITLDQLYVTRSAPEDKILGRLNGPGLTLVVGEPGAGKTSMLWNLSRRLEDAGRRFAMIRATDLPSGEHVDADPIWKGLDDPSALPGVLMIDTVDLLLQQGEVPGLLANLIAGAKAHFGALILTCRVRESVLFDRFRAQVDMAEIELDMFDEQELPQAVDAYSRSFLDADSDEAHEIHGRVLTAVTRGLPISDVCRRPLTLRMLFETAMDPDDFNDEMDITDLYHRYWDTRVKDDRRLGVGPGSGADLSLLVAEFAVSMVSRGLPLAATADLDAAARERAADAAETLVRRSVLHRLSDGATYEFFHQTFFEYAAARACLSMGDDAAAGMLRHSAALADDLFLAAVAQQTIVYASSERTPGQAFDEAFSDMLTSAEEGTRQTAVAALAQAKHRGPLTNATALMLLSANDTGLERHYLRNVTTVRHHDVRLVLSELTSIWKNAGERIRIEMLPVFRRLSAAHPAEMVEFLKRPADRRSDVLRWYHDLGPEKIRAHRRPLLDLIEGLAGQDRDWATAELLRLAAVIPQGTASREALADVLATAARIVTSRLAKQALISSPPPMPTTKVIGIHELEAALADLHRSLWNDEGRDCEAIAAEIAAFPDEGYTLDRRVMLRALAARLVGRGVGVTARVVSQLLGSGRPRLQSDVADNLLRYLIEAALDPGTRGDEAAAWVLEQCLTALRSLPGKPFGRNGARTRPAIYRDALEHARIEPDAVASVLSDERRVNVWSLKDGLVALLPAAAIGGHPTAAAVLAEWSGRSAPAAGKPAREIRKIIVYRLKLLSATRTEALDHLIQDALVEGDCQFLEGAFGLFRASAGEPAVRTYVPKVVEIASSVVQEAKDPKVRRYGYSLLSTPEAEPLVPTGLILTGLRNETEALNPVLDILRTGLDDYTERWQEGSDFDEASSLLASLAESDAVTAGARIRARELLRDLYCHSGPIRSPAERAATVTAAVAMTVPHGSSGDVHRIAPLGFLIARLAPVDLDRASDLLLDGAAYVATAPWRTRSHRYTLGQHWRGAVGAVLRRLDLPSWRRTLEALSQLDAEVFAVALETSVKLHPREKEFLLAVSSGAEQQAQTRLRKALQRQQRVRGGTTTWPEFHRRWAAADHPPGILRGALGSSDHRPSSPRGPDVTAIDIDNPESPVRRRRKWLRGTFIALGVVLVLAVAGLGGAGWYFSNEVLVPDHSPSEYSLTVESVDGATVTITRDEDSEKGGVWGLAWEDGHAVVGDVVAEDEDTVTRTLQGVLFGDLAEGTKVRMDMYGYRGDPQTALGLAFEEVQIPTDLGDAPAWLVPADGDTWVIGVHGRNATREEMLRSTEVYHGLGYPVLDVTYRNDEERPPPRTGS
nr:hypothetical protein GCM10025732_24240 [Glycomyces mayteni]